MAEVEILLAAYNGEKYIKEQLDSILNQSFRDFRVIIRDDGSTDATPRIIKEYERLYPDVIRVVTDEAVCRGPAANFFRLMKYASADYVMFSDQDDFWLPDKIKVTLDGMKTLEAENGKDTPALVVAECELVDESLRSLNRVFIRDYGLYFKILLYANCVTGCLTMINRSLYTRVLEDGGYGEGITFHDWWLALYASEFGALRHIPRKVMLYRQHGDNYAGAGEAPPETFYRRIARMIKNPVKRFRDARYVYLKNLSVTHRQAVVFYSRYAGRMSEVSRKQTENFLKLCDKSRLVRLRALIQEDYLMGDYLDKLRQLIFMVMDITVNEKTGRRV